jgi:hypothetical protein
MDRVFLLRSNKTGAMRVTVSGNTAANSCTCLGYVEIEKGNYVQHKARRLGIGAMTEQEATALLEMFGAFIHQEANCGS